MPDPAAVPPTSPSADSPTPPPTATLTVFRLATLFTLLAVAMGSVVCATGSGAACSTWPGCQQGQISPGWELSPIIEFTHRVVAVASGPLVLAAAVLSLRLPGRDRWVRILPWVALAGALAAGVFGRMVVLSTLPTWLGAVDLFSALTAMTVMTVATVRAGRLAGAGASAGSGDDVGVGAAGGRPVTATARLATASVGVLVAMHVTGIFAAGTGSYTRCMGWPLWRLIDSDGADWLQGARLGLAVLAAVLVVSTAVVAAREERWRGFGVAVATLFATEMVLGLVILTRDLALGVATAYSVVAVALLWCLGLLAAVAGSARVRSDRSPLLPPESHREPARPGRR